MTRALAIDFAASGARPPVAGVAVLALALALVAVLGWHYRNLLSDIERMEAKLEAREAGGTRRPAANARSPETSAELARAQRVLAQLEIPWNGLFTAVEGAVGEKVALLGVQPDAANARVIIAGEAKNVDEALWFAQRLSASGPLADAFLTGHEVRRDGAQRPVRFTLQARWLAMERVP